MRRRTILGVAFLAAIVPTPLWAQDDDDWDEQESAPSVEVHGFVESATAARVVDDPTISDQFLSGEGRFRLEVRHEGERASASFKGDVIADAVSSSIEIDLREAVVMARLGASVELRAGRQVLTWGTGDLLFLNDLFPKDFVSFFVGRSDEYLKAPATAIRLGVFTSVVDVDFVWMPIFEPDRYIRGDRLSFYSPQAGALVGGDTATLEVARPDRDLKNGELAARIYGAVGAIELAAYAYQGFTKQPQSFDSTSAQAIFSRLGVYGLSLRGALLGGIANVEGAYYHAWDDEAGDDPLVPNSQLRWLLGYEREIVKRLTLGLQYYLEHTLRHDRLLAASASPSGEPDELRHVATLRLTWLLLRDDLALSLFAFVSPSDRDVHLRPSLRYKLTDAMALAIGANVMIGRDEHTFFGQLEKNTNAYGRLRYSF